MESLLWCEEVIEASPQSRRTAETVQSAPPSPSSASSTEVSFRGQAFVRPNLPCNSVYGIFEAKEGEEVEDEELSIAGLLKRQAQFWPGESYSRKLNLNSDLYHARALAARWMVKAHSEFNFSPVTVALAVNYMDRYLNKSLALAWKPWMMELLSVACLSLAAKMEEVDVPAIVDLQAFEGFDHAFEAKTVQRMELNVLCALNWRLNSITAFSFVEKAINQFQLRDHLKSSLMARTSELLLCAFQEVELMEFEPALLGVSSVCFALEEILPVQADQLKLFLLKYIPTNNESVRRCYVQMESLIVDPICTTTESGSTKFPLSPNTVCYHIVEVNTSEETSPFFDCATFTFKRLNAEEIVTYTKRQRRC